MSRIERQRRIQAWLKWINAHRNTLKEIGLPPEVYLDLDHWEDFLQNGHLHWHLETSTGFDFSELNKEQTEHLLRFLKAHEEFCPDYIPLRQWLQLRLGN